MRTFTFILKQKHAMGTQKVVSIVTDLPTYDLAFAYARGLVIDQVAAMPEKWFVDDFFTADQTIISTNTGRSS